MTDQDDQRDWDQRLAELRAQYEEWRAEHPIPELPPSLQKIADATGPMYLDPDGRPIDQAEWSLLLEERNRTAGQPETWWSKKTEVDEVRVSTVWLGLNHNWMPGRPPLFWETMIFGGEWDQEQWRYSSRAEAFDDHERIVRALRAGKNPNS